MELPSRLGHTGVSYRQVDHWVRRGWLRPDNPHGGPGSVRQWTNDELDVAVRMAQLVKAGLAPEVAAKAAREGAEAWLSPRVKVVIAS